MTFLSVEDVDVLFRTRNSEIQALKNINISIKEGEFVSVIGPSGCGKSTLLHMVAGFIRPSRGRVTVEGNAINGPGAERGIVMQRPLLLPWMTVYGNVALGPRVHRMPPDELRRTVKYYLELVNLGQFADKRPYELSGGMQQRVAVARALANDSRVLLMDEPFGALDALTREAMQLELLRIWSVTRKTVLLVTHDVEEAVACGTRTIVMTPRPGKIALDVDMGFSAQILESGLNMKSLRGVKSTPCFIRMREAVMEPILEA